MPQETIVYNVTTKVSHHIHQAWVQWMQQHHIPAMIGTGCFTKSVIMKLKDIDDSEGYTYAVQYYAASETDYKRYLSQYATALRKETIDKWGDQIIAFRTVMEIVN